MKNEFPISNLRAKYADKTADGKDISEAIAEAQLAGEIPVLTSETAEEIYNTKPKFIKYNTRVFVLQEIADPDVYYSSVYNETMCGIDIENDNDSYSFTVTEYYPASKDDVVASQRAASIPELTENNIAEIFTTRPKFISYGIEGSDPIVFVIQDNSDNTTAYYTSVYDTDSNALIITANNITVVTNHLATEDYVDENKGTNLYKHTITYGTGGIIELVSSDETLNSTSPVFCILSIVKGLTNLPTFADAIRAYMHFPGSLALGIQYFDSNNAPAFINIPVSASVDTVTPL